MKIYSGSNLKSTIIALVIRNQFYCLLGSCSFWFGHLSDALRPGEEVHTGTFADLFSCSTYSCHHHLLHIACGKKTHIKVDLLVIVQF